MSAEAWRTERDKALAATQEVAESLLIGRTVVSVKARPHADSCDAENVVELTLNDGTTVAFSGGYGGYTGNSCDEYVELIGVYQVHA